jgi:hypothetical protein
MKPIKLGFASRISAFLTLSALIFSACAPQQPKTALPGESSSTPNPPLQQPITLPEDADSGLKAVAQVGLLQQLSIPAQATLTAQGTLPVSVMLDWAYADKNRLALGWTINGLSAKKDANLADYICDPYFAKKDGIEFGKYGVLRYIRPESGEFGGPIHLMYIYYQDVAAEKAGTMDFTVDLTIGDCRTAKTGVDSALNPDVKTTPIPMIGNYQVSFKLPVHDGISVHPDQVVKSNEITARLASIAASPSYMIARICFSTDEMKQKLGNWQDAGWNIDAMSQINSGDWVESNFNYPTLTSSEQCTDLGFGVSLLEKEKNQIAIKVSPSVEGLKEDWEFSLQTTKITP